VIDEYGESQTAGRSHRSPFVCPSYPGAAAWNKKPFRISYSESKLSLRKWPIYTVRNKSGGNE